MCDWQKYLVLRSLRCDRPARDYAMRYCCRCQFCQYAGAVRGPSLTSGSEPLVAKGSFHGEVTMYTTRAVLCGVLLLGEVIGVAQTVIRIAPPPPVRVGVVGVAPGPGYVWIGGYQRWNGTGYVWVAGRWVRPPRAGVVWVAPRYVQSGGVWVFHKGYWR